MFLTIGILALSLGYTYSRIYCLVKKINNNLGEKDVQIADIVIFLTTLWCIDKCIEMYIGLIQ